MSDNLQQLIGKWVHVRTGSTEIYGYGGLPTDFYGILGAADDAALYVQLANGETAYLPLNSVRRLAEMPPPAPDGDAGILLRPADEECLPLLQPASGTASDVDRLPRAIDTVARIVPRRFRR